MPHLYCELAKKTVEFYIKKGEVISPFNDSLFRNLKNQVFISEFEELRNKESEIKTCLPQDVLSQKAGTFVTIMEQENLRGCVGTYLPTKNNVAEEIIHNAIAAATEDHRFLPIREQDLHHLSYVVYILDKPELVEDLKELDPKKYGIIVKNVPLDGGFIPKSGLLLPDLKDIDTIEKQVAIACQKANIDPTQEKILIYKFTADKYQ